MNLLKLKRGQGLSLNAIVIAALVMIVLIVLIVIFMKGMEPISPALDDEHCARQAGKWCNAGAACESIDASDTQAGKICCPVTYIGDDC